MEQLTIGKLAKGPKSALKQSVIMNDVGLFQGRHGRMPVIGRTPRGWLNALSLLSVQRRWGFL